MIITTNDYAAAARKAVRTLGADAPMASLYDHAWASLVDAGADPEALDADDLDAGLQRAINAGARA
jgi:hypothetical protein